MTTLREAAQMAKRIIAERMCSDCDGHVCCWADGAFVLNAIDKALAQPVVNQQLTTEPEPVAYDVDGATVYIKPPIHNGKYLTGYTAPPHREWQGLTQEEVRRIVQSNTDPWCDTPETDGYGVAEMVESKLREKNGNF